jgi:K+-transporting ATPase ATPase C chain
MRTLIKPALSLLLALTLLTGVVYPLLITAIAQVVFPAQANGSLIQSNGKLAGSALIGQPFDHPKYFWSRLSATAPFQYNAAASAGSNYGPVNEKLLETMQARIQALRRSDSTNTLPIPVDLVTASGSGLDPHLSPAAAFYQIPRLARARNLDEKVVRQLVEKHFEGRQLGFLGEPRVNVLRLNLALDGLQSRQ